MTFTLTVAFWWIIPIFITGTGIYLWVEKQDTPQNIFYVWLFLMAIVFGSRFLP